MDMNVQTRDLLWRVGLMIDKVIGGVIGNGGVQIGKLLDVQHGHLIVDPNLQYLVVGRNPNGQNSEMR